MTIDNDEISKPVIKLGKLITSLKKFNLNLT